MPKNIKKKKKNRLRGTKYQVTSNEMRIDGRKQTSTRYKIVHTAVPYVPVCNKGNGTNELWDNHPVPLQTKQHQIHIHGIALAIKQHQIHIHGIVYTLEKKEEENR